jgi:hypothetical protein
VRIMGCDDRRQFLPRNDDLHLSEKLLFAGAFVMLFETPVDKTRLVYSERSFSSNFFRDRIIANYRN